MKWSAMIEIKHCLKEPPDDSREWNRKASGEGKGAGTMVV
jgi:hypothetical protein